MDICPCSPLSLHLPVCVSWSPIPPVSPLPSFFCSPVTTSLSCMSVSLLFCLFALYTGYFQVVYISSIIWYLSFSELFYFNLMTASPYLVLQSLTFHGWVVFPVCVHGLVFIHSSIHDIFAVISLIAKEMAAHASALAWRILWTEEPGGLLSMGSHRVGRDWSDLACMHWLILRVLP